MGAQHDFGYSFSSNDLIVPMTVDEISDRIDDLANDPSDFSIDNTSGQISITFSFYSSYTHLNEFMENVSNLLKTILKPKSHVSVYYEEVTLEDNSFTV